MAVMKVQKGIPLRDNDSAHFSSNDSARRQTPPRVAPRLSAQVKNMRVRDKKNSLSGRK